MSFFPFRLNYFVHAECGTHANHITHLPIDSRRGLTASKTNLRADDEAAADDDDDGDSC